MPDQKNQLTTKEAIADIAFRYFLEKGYEATNLRKISDEVGIKAASIYFYYSSKKELFNEIFNEHCQQILEPVKHQLLEETGEAVVRLKNVFIAGIKTSMENNASYRFWIRYLMFPPEELLMDIRHHNEQWQDKEYELCKKLLTECINGYKLVGELEPKLLFSQLKRYQRSIIFEILITGIAADHETIDYHWNRFWKEWFLDDTK